MVSDAAPNWPEWPSRVYLFVPDVDVTYRRALDHAAVTLMQPQDEAYGDRVAGVVDPLGNQMATSLASLGRGT